jgi:aspartokinase/homoserine dehydrogenase 1
MSSTSLRVFKFGGSSVGRAESLSKVLQIIASERTTSPLAVVVSAFGDTTDHLIEAATFAARGDIAASLARLQAVRSAALEPIEHVLRARAADTTNVAPTVHRTLEPLDALLRAVAVLGEVSPRTRDEILSYGERLSASLIALALGSTQVDAVAVDARTWVVTDAGHGDARVDLEATRARVRALAASWKGGLVSVHTGFIGATREGVTTTLGRNGSDYTAAVLAASLGAAEVTLFTDVSGVMTADPTLVQEAYTVPHLSYRETLELSGLGLRMLHSRTVLPLYEASIPLRIRNTGDLSATGTLIDRDGSADIAKPTCIVSLEHLAMVDVEGTLRAIDTHLDARITRALELANIPVTLSVTGHRGSGIACVVEEAHAARAATVIDEALQSERASGHVSAARVARAVAVVTLVAEAMGQTVNVSGTFFSAIGAAGVNVRASAQGATSRAISAVVNAADVRETVQAVHAAFNLATERVSVLLLGKGTVGGNLLSQLASAHESLRSRHDLDVRLVGLVDSRASVFDERGIEPGRAIGLVKEASAASLAVELPALLDRLARAQVPVLVDCTAESGMESVYEAALARGIHVVAANKKPFSAAHPARSRLFELARRHHRGLRYETTVGASLPVIDTLKNLVRTGDRVRRIEASLSGTLGFLSNEVSRGRALSAAVRDARARGYTEPHPRDDLAGTDAARKALILARELGHVIELDDVQVEPFVPKALLAENDVSRFLAALEAHDARFAEDIRGARDEGKVLRYLATIEVGSELTLRVGPTLVPADHPAARLRGTEAQVAFYTDRYSDLPLIVQGAGAGGAITAAGVLADVLAIGRERRLGPRRR